MPKQKTNNATLSGYAKTYFLPSFYQVSTKFRPNSLTFEAILQMKTDERRATPQQYGGCFATHGWEGLRPSPLGGRFATWGASPPLGGRFATCLLRPNRPEKGNHLASLGG